MRDSACGSASPSSAWIRDATISGTTRSLSALRNSVPMKPPASTISESGEDSPPTSIAHASAIAICQWRATALLSRRVVRDFRGRAQLLHLDGVADVVAERLEFLAGILVAQLLAQALHILRRCAREIAVLHFGKEHRSDVAVAEHDLLEARLVALRARQVEQHADDRAIDLGIVTLDRAGALELDAGLLRGLFGLLALAHEVQHRLRLLDRLVLRGLVAQLVADVVGDFLQLLLPRRFVLRLAHDDDVARADRDRLAVLVAAEHFGRERRFLDRVV